MGYKTRDVEGNKQKSTNEIIQEKTNRNVRDI